MSINDVYFCKNKKHHRGFTSIAAEMNDIQFGCRIQLRLTNEKGHVRPGLSEKRIRAELCEDWYGKKALPGSSPY